MSRTYRKTTVASPRRLVDIESLLAAGLAVGLLFISMSVSGTGATDSSLRLITLGASAGTVSLAFLSALSRRRTKADALAVVFFAYFAIIGIQSGTQSNVLQTVLSIIGALMSLAATRADLHAIFFRFRHWILVVVVISLLPAFLGHGFSAGRTWLRFVPGRYFGFSNPDAFGFVAGLAILLALPVLRTTRGRALLAAGGLLFVISSAYTALIATALAAAAYFLLAKGKGSRFLQWGVSLFGVVTVGALTWIPTPSGIAAFEWLSQRLSLSSRTLIWVQLLQLSRGTGYFWTGLGDRGVQGLTLEIGGLGTAHTTILQIFLANGFVVTVCFVLVSASASVRILGRLSLAPSRDHRLALAVLVYWFVTSLVSTQPGTPLGLAVIVLAAIPSLAFESDSGRLSDASRGVLASRTLRTSTSSRQ